MANKGLIFDIQHFAVHDGPGIRTIVFLKGCNFRCPWCENPEGISFKPQIIYTPQRCIGDFECINVCPENAILENSESNIVEINWRKCNGCLKCSSICYPDAIKTVGRWMTVDEVMEEIKRDEIFYGEVGGVTLSGGEPTLQKDFIIEILMRCNKAGINTALETNASIDEEEFSKILNHVDHLLIDIKHMDAKLHTELTGMDNKNTLRNFKLAVNSSSRVVARVPVIPLFNMNMNDILDIAKFVSESGGNEIHLLPYHSLGSSKSENIGRKYEYPIKNSVSNRDLIPFKREIEKNYGLSVILGG